MEQQGPQPTTTNAATEPAAPAAAPPRRWRRWLRRASRIAALAVLLGAASATVALAWLWPRCAGVECPSVQRLRDYRPPQASLIYDRDGGLLARLAPEQRIVVPYSALPKHLVDAFLAVEDRRFWDHGGVDWRRSVGALWRDVRSLSAREGSSTITMQLARNVFPEHLTRARTLRRKLWEVVLARQIESSFSKQQILELYLNQIYLGDGRYGVEAASRNYFGKPVKDTTLAEAAVLAALPKAPATYDPRRAPQLARKRRNLVLALMQSAGFITESQMKQAQKPRIKLSKPQDPFSAPWVEGWVRKELRERFGPDAEVRGLRVHTTIDPKIQLAAEQELGGQVIAVEAGRLGRFRGKQCEGKVVDDPDQCLQGLLVALSPVSGDVLALVGGRDHDLSQFDRATQARRQPGSAFKPFIYAAALRQGWPTTTVLGAGPEPQEGDYNPAEGGMETHGPLTMREALRTSSNRAAVELGGRVGVRAVAQLAKDLGIGSPIPDWPSTFLGAAALSPLELTAAYAAFVNGGYRIKPRLIAFVESVDGRPLFAAPVERTQVLDPAIAFVMADLLRGVVDGGTGKRARVSGLPESVAIAGKTGTTNGAQDAWFVGATPDAVVTAWLGFDRPRTIAASATGGRLAAPVVGRVLREVYRHRPPPPPLQPPPNVALREIDTGTGKLATSGCPGEQVVREWLLASAAPLEECPLHRGGVGGFFQRVFGAVFGK